VARQNILHSFCFVKAFSHTSIALLSIVGAPFTLRAEAQGNGVLAAPTSAAYADLTNASNKMLGDLHSALPHANTIVLYDATAFAAVPYYGSTTDLVRTAAGNICAADTGTFGSRAIVPTVDVGTSAAGLASLIQLTIPTYAIQGQNLALDNSALVGSFATAAKATGYTVINPAYLLPAVSQNTLTCGNFESSTSLADLWKFVNSQASADHAKAASQKPLQDALDAFQKMKDVLLSSDKAPPLLGHALAVESLARSVEQPSQVAVIDMRLDAVDIDSTTKTVLWWRKTKFSANVAAHYWIFSAHGSGAGFGIVLVEPGYVNILTKNLDLKSYAGNGLQ
jgi:hypothetical protein